MKIKISIIISVILILGVAGYFFFSGEDVERVDPLIKLRESINEQVEAENIDIKYSSDKYARASIIQEGKEYDVYLLSIQDEWKTVLVTDEPAYCERMERFGFPSNFMRDCVLEFPGSVSIDEFADVIDEALGESFTIIAQLSDSQDPDCGCINLDTDDGNITLAYDGDLILDPGDTVVIDVVVEEEGVVIEDIEDLDGNRRETNTNYLNDEPNTVEADPYIRYYIDADNTGRLQLLND